MEEHELSTVFDEVLAALLTGKILVLEEVGVVADLSQLQRRDISDFGLMVRKTRRRNKMSLTKETKNKRERRKKEKRFWCYLDDDVHQTLLADLEGFED